MEPSTMLFLGKLSLGLVMGFGGLGSALGVLAAGQAAAGAWAKQGKEGKALGSYTIMIGMPLSQTLYCLVLYFAMLTSAAQPENGPILLGVSLGVGFCQFISAYAQGKIGAAGIRCLAENEDKGRGGIITAMGIAETVALISLAVGILLLNSDIIVKAITATAPAVG